MNGDFVGQWTVWTETGLIILALLIWGSEWDIDEGSIDGMLDDWWATSEDGNEQRKVEEQREKESDKGGIAEIKMPRKFAVTVDDDDEGVPQWNRSNIQAESRNSVLCRSCEVFLGGSEKGASVKPTEIYGIIISPASHDQD
ncbi:hypothetical protein BELL_0007g00010 [Botrytis elliptica]|uniref:Uncharacterized protein n=1 Tax=Botrytis elliptica TaxID=278938 RepID=A0A4Z1K2S6_9HELO|nr:hypothetical protein BELL_0007g00010 [Botrytis elliptica]